MACSSPDQVIIIIIKTYCYNLVIIDFDDSVLVKSIRFLDRVAVSLCQQKKRKIYYEFHR